MLNSCEYTFCFCAWHYQIIINMLQGCETLQLLEVGELASTVINNDIVA